MKRLLSFLLAAFLSVSTVVPAQAFMLAGKLRVTHAVVAVTYTTLDPANKGTNITLSATNHTALNVGGASQFVRSILSVTASKWYWETTIGVVASQPIVGVVDATASVNSTVGSDTHGWGYQYNGLKVNAGGSAAYGASYTTGDVIGTALDEGAGTVTFYKNCTTQGQAYSGLPSGIYAAVNLGNTDTMTVNFGATAFTCSVPGGYNSGLYS